MKKRIKNIPNTASEYLLIVSATLTILVTLLGYYNFDSKTPLIYANDYVLALNRAKNISQDLNYLTNPQLGLPGIQQFHDFHLTAYNDYIWLGIISFITKDPIVMLNIFSIVAFCLISICSYYTLKTLLKNKQISFALALLYSFLPYHLFKISQHVHLTTYYTVPLAILLAYDFATPKHKILGLWAKLFIALLVAISNPYYFFMSLCIIFVGIAVGTLRSSAKNLYFREVLPVVVTLISVFLIISSPGWLHWKKYGKPDSFNNREISHLETYGLRITHLIFPSENHRIESLRTPTIKYSSFVTDEAENKSNYMGIVALFGFIVLLAYPFIKKANILKTNIRDKLDVLSTFIYAAILIGIPGGLATLVGVFFYPYLRVFSRISVFITFISLLAVGLLLAQMNLKNRKALLLVLAPILLVGLLDQTPANFYVQRNSAYQKEYLEDLEFARLLDEVSKNKNVFQDPVLFYPEGGNYHLMKIPLLTKNVSWNTGALKDRGSYMLQTNVYKENTMETLQSIIDLGFEGLIVNNEHENATLDHQEVYALIGNEALKHPEKEIYFFDLTKIDYEKRKAMPHALYLTNGCVKTRLPKGKKTTEYFCDKNFKIIAVNYNKNEIEAEIKVTFTFSESDNNIKLTGFLSDNMHVEDTKYEYVKKIELPVGESVINVIVETASKNEVPKDVVKSKTFEYYNVRVSF